MRQSRSLIIQSGATLARTALVAGTTFLASTAFLAGTVLLAVPSAGAETLGMDPADLSVPINEKGTTARSRSRSNKTPSPSKAAGPSKAAATPKGTAPPPAVAPDFAPPPASEPVHAVASSGSSELKRWGVTTSLNIPHPFFLEGIYRFDSTWSAGLGLGGIHLKNIERNGEPMEMNMLASDVRVRWHPWGGSFFAGFALGVQKFNGAIAGIVPVTLVAASGSQVVDVPTTVTADITSIYLTPHMGWFKVYENGFVLGFDFGIQLPANVRSSLDVQTDSSGLTAVGQEGFRSTPRYLAMEAEVQAAIDTFGKLPLPYITVIRIGWMF